MKILSHGQCEYIYTMIFKVRISGLWAIYGSHIGIRVAKNRSVCCSKGNCATRLIARAIISCFHYSYRNIIIT